MQPVRQLDSTLGGSFELGVQRRRVTGVVGVDAGADRRSLDVDPAGPDALAAQRLVEAGHRRQVGELAQDEHVERHLEASVRTPARRRVLLPGTPALVVTDDRLATGPDVNAVDHASDEDRIRAVAERQRRQRGLIVGESEAQLQSVRPPFIAVARLLAEIADQVGLHRPQRGGPDRLGAPTGELPLGAVRQLVQELVEDRYVLIEPEELEALDPKATKTIDIEEFVDLVEIDPIFYDHSYYLAPTAGGAKAYALLLEAMREAGKVGIGRVVLRSKQQLCALRPAGDVMTMATMLFGDEVVAPDRIDELDAVGEAQATQRELKMAQQLIESLSGEFDPTKYRDEYRERVIDLIERKAAGEEIAVQPQAEETSPAPDLMAALEASLAAVRGEEPEPAGTPKPRSRAASGSGKPAGGSGKRASGASKSNGSAGGSTESDGSSAPKPTRSRAKAKG